MLMPYLVRIVPVLVMPPAKFELLTEMPRPLAVAAAMVPALLMPPEKVGP